MCSSDLIADAMSQPIGSVRIIRILNSVVCVAILCSEKSIGITCNKLAILIDRQRIAVRIVAVNLARSSCGFRKETVLAFFRRAPEDALLLRNHKGITTTNVSIL